ncbi:zinc finger domain-containing protein [Cellulosimicrobium arenosum]|uniref:DNA-(apurinic or apyrimidinic site) lyase n=1 Tax=Cellulosimicrobium arenosum TaxID=2708133 RepID=A0A927J284_9MICO|nr:Fpg/Nei family DNA glycosylase [Cellulosimicrobium arenosum]
MPEGHTVHRLARTFLDLFLGKQLAVSSPQGRFDAGAAVVDGHVLVASEAWGKHLFLGFAPRPGAGPATTAGCRRWLRVHLGLYGAWTFAGDGSTAVAHAIGAPRRRVGERETVPAGAPGPSASGQGPDVAWSAPPPRGAVRARLLGEHAVADLTGPAACEVITDAEKRAVTGRLGPDPLREVVPGEPDPRETFVSRVRRSRTPVGVLLMNQDVVAGVGNIYRAESSFRAGLDPLRPGRDVPAAVLRAIWDDLVVLMRAGARDGAIVTTRPEDRDAVAGAGPGARTVRQNTDGVPGTVPADDAFYVYHRDGLPCRVCGTPVLRSELAGRTLYRCARCQG